MQYKASPYLVDAIAQSPVAFSLEVGDTGNFGIDPTQSKLKSQ